MDVKKNSVSYESRDLKPEFYVKAKYQFLLVFQMLKVLNTYQKVHEHLSWLFRHFFFASLDHLKTFFLPEKNTFLF